MFDFLKTEMVLRWARQSEYIVGVGSILTACILSATYFSMWGNSLTTGVGPLYMFILAYPAICAARLFWYHLKSRKAALISANGTVSEASNPIIFGWVCVISDIFFLTALIFSVSDSFNAPSSVLQSPLYVGYFVLMALHALRFNPVQVLSMGGLACLSWTGLLVMFSSNGAVLTPLFSDYGNPGLISMSAESTKIGGFAIASLLLWFATHRAKLLLDAVIETRTLDLKLREANVAVAAKTEVLENMNQEIKGPIGGVMGMSEALRRTDLTREQTRYVDAIEQSSQTLLTAVQNVLDITQTDEASLKSQFSEFNIRKSLDSLGKRFGPLARKKKIDLLVDIDTKSQHFIVGSEKRFVQTVSNILDNAVKFSHTGCIRLKVSCEAVDSEKALLSVNVSDTGVGMNAQKLERVRDKLAGKSNPVDETGLGLMISQMFVQARGGALNIESKPAEGTIVSYSFPVSYVKKSMVPHAISKKSRQLKTLRLLIVDDQAVAADVLQNQLVAMGVMPQMVTNVQDACAAINAAHNAGKTYDVVMVDYDMPDTDGLHLAKLIRSREELNDSKLVILSAVDDETAEQAFQDTGITAYVKKPYRFTDIQTALLKALDTPAAMSADIADVA